MTIPLIVVAIDDPEDPKTWSGTPKALMEALRRLDYVVEGVAADVPSRFDKTLYTLIGLPLYGRGARAFRQYYGTRNRRIKGRLSAARGAREPAQYLHTDHVWLPYAGFGSSDFMFRDTSWGSYAKSQGVGPRLQRRVGRDLRLALRDVQHVFATSNWARDALIEEGANPQNVTVVGTGVGNLVRPYLGEKDYQNKRTLCVAKVRFENKGIDLLLEGFRLARERDHELTLDLVTPDGRFAAQDGVTFHSDLSSTELTELYQKSSLYAMPARYEPWGLVYLEAQLSRTPILGSSRCSFPELANGGETGFIVDELSAEGVCDAILLAHSDPERLERMGQKALRFASEFTWDRTARVMCGVMRAPIE